MKVLILGGSGMAGHMIYQYLQELQKYNVFYTTRNRDDSRGIFLDVRDFRRLKEIINGLKPEIVINAVGILNQMAEDYPQEAIKINSLLPHVLVDYLNDIGGKLFHISTDCVFSGEVQEEVTNDMFKQGRYKETDKPNGTSMYSKTKALGEINSNEHVTIRTSIIGPEIKRDGIGLFHWFMKSENSVYGFKNVLWNGVTTLELAKAIHVMIEKEVSGLYHLTSPEIVSKYDLLKIIQSIFDKTDIEIYPYYDIQLNRTLAQTRSDFHYHAPPYKNMIQELFEWMTRHE